VVKITAQLCGVLPATRRFASKAVFKYLRCAMEAGSGLTSVKSATILAGFRRRNFHFHGRLAA
jgi:hypothetical protein